MRTYCFDMINVGRIIAPDSNSIRFAMQVVGDDLLGAMKIASPISQSEDVKAAVVELSTIRNAVTAFRRLLHHSKTREERESGKAAARKAQLSSLTVPLEDVSEGTGTAVPGLRSPPGRTE